MMRRTLRVGVLTAVLVLLAYGCAATDSAPRAIAAAPDCATASGIHACLDREVVEIDGVVYSGIYRYRDEYDVCLLELVPNYQFDRRERARDLLQDPANHFYARFGMGAGSRNCPPFNDSDGYISVSSSLDFAVAKLIGENIDDWSEFVERNAERPCAEIQNQLKSQIDYIDVRRGERNPVIVIDYRNICFSPEYRNWLRFTLTFDRETQTEIDRQVEYLHD